MDMTASAGALERERPYRDRAQARGSSVQGWIACTLLLAVAFATFAFNVHHGLGIYPDTTRYMGISPVPYDAPVYHWMLTGGHALGVSLLTAAMVVAIACLFANVVLVFALVQRGSHDWRFAAAATALLILAPQFVTLHAGAMSEAPFMMFLLGTLWFALDYFEHGRRRDLLIASILLGVATLTRFTGPPMGAAIALVILARPGVPMGRRIADCVLLALLGGALFFAWVGWSTETVGHSIGRELRFYGNMGPQQWHNNLETLAAWLFPDQVPLGARVAVLLGLFGFSGRQTLSHWQRWRAMAPGTVFDLRTPLSLVLAAFLVAYLAFIWLSTSLEANLSLNGRYALPAYFAFVMLMGVEASGLDLSRKGERGVLIALIVVGAAVLVSHGARSAIRTHEVYAKGFGYNAKVWRESPTIAAVHTLPADAVIFSNAPEVIALLDVGRRALLSPQERQLRTDRPDPNNPVTRQIADLRASAAGAAPVYLVMFDNVDWRFYLATEDRLVRDLSLPAPTRLPDGRIYRVPPPPAATAPR
ncbi:dolichyl-phosphate-mannose-protein mannosyltransferase [Novosphingobium sp. PhB165]|uniref:glycosyltransferase family 39 protein n=1 Tax=Novosphingobium sp. PhB165 TaxID=2485105 RepID=UPI0010506EDE|nr:glycosyltransferase family 39 protein [Novosphingobium sp. PhB165]TCM21400.1 dolichyl-phosphate-mannose-protein mannosyltransferase [Novosphingobium sp. PhB165]